MPQFVKFTNEGDRPFDFHHQNKKRVIGPGEDAIVPWDLACSLFGDPYTLDDGKKNDRQRTIKSVRGNFGYQSGMMTEDEWDAIRPHVAVYDLETQSRIYMILEDPDGLKSLPDVEVIEANDQVAYLQRQLAQVQATLATLTQRDHDTAQAATSSHGAGEGNILAPSTDIPEIPEVGKDGGPTGTLVIPPQNTDAVSTDGPGGTPAGTAGLAPRKK